MQISFSGPPAGCKFHSVGRHWCKFHSVGRQPDANYIWLAALQYKIPKFINSLHAAGDQPNEFCILHCKKAIGVLYFRRVILFPVMERSISWVKNIFPSPSAFLFITDDTKIYFYSTDEQKSIIYVRKQIPSSLMKNVEIVLEYFDVEVKECRKIPQNVAKFPSTSWKCAVSHFSHKMALNNFFMD